jgi:anti-sigma-K factor RskA
VSSEQNRSFWRRNVLVITIVALVLIVVVLPFVLSNTLRPG